MSIPFKYKPVETKFIHSLWTDHQIKIKPNLKQQTGGSIEKIKYQDDGQTYTLNLSIDKEPYHYYITVLTPDKSECITVIIYKNEKNAIIHNMSYYKECAVEGLKYPGGGNILLKFILNYLIKNKQKYNINRILLTDNSYLYCDNCSNNVKLAQLKMITSGRTWYMRYGFLPYDSLKNTPSKSLYKAIDHNKKIIDKLKTKQIHLELIFKNIHKQEHIKIDIKEINRLKNKYPLLRDFIKRLVSEYKKYCCFLSYLLEHLFDPLNKYNLIDFYRKQFYFDI